MAHSSARLDSGHSDFFKVKFLVLGSDDVSSLLQELEVNGSAPSGHIAKEVFKWVLPDLFFSLRGKEFFYICLKRLLGFGLVVEEPFIAINYYKLPEDFISLINMISRANLNFMKLI